VGVCSLAARIGTMLGVMASDDSGLANLSSSTLVGAGLASAASGVAIALILAEPANCPLQESKPDQNQKDVDEETELQLS